MKDYIFKTFHHAVVIDLREYVYSKEIILIKSATDYR